MPLSRNFLPIIFNGRRFDRGMQLYELMSQREDPEALLESYTSTYKDCGRFVGEIGRFVRERVKMVEVSPPCALVNGTLVDDPFIGNRFGAWADTALDAARQTMAQKIIGIDYADIASGYYRAAWLPPPEIHSSLRPAVFHYPACGYAGVLAEMLGESVPSAPSALPLDTVAINIAFLTGYPEGNESVVFVVDESPIYRVTNQEACAGILFGESRLVVEYRGDCDVAAELARLDICHAAQLCGQISINYPLPTIGNLARCPTLYTSNLNDQLIRHMLSMKQPASTT